MIPACLYEWSDKILEDVIAEEGLDITQEEASECLKLYLESVVVGLEDPRLPRVTMFMWTFCFNKMSCNINNGLGYQAEESDYKKSLKEYLFPIRERTIAEENKEDLSHSWKSKRVKARFAKLRDKYFELKTSYF